MVHIFYYRSSARIPEDIFNDHLQQLPLQLRQKVLAYRQWQDAERSLMGNILLNKGLKQLGFPKYTLNDIKYGTYKKPYFDNEVHFNISHSGKYTVCAISSSNIVGIDVEEVNEIPLGDFTQFFYEEEWQRVLDSPDLLTAFYTLWTKKESFLKVIGSGLNVPLNQVVIVDNTIRWDNQLWILQEIKLEPTHICFLCTDEPLPAFTVHPPF